MNTRPWIALRWTARVAAAMTLAAPAPLCAQAGQNEKPVLEIYGFGQADAISDIKQNNPSWYDVNRPSKLASVPDEFGEVVFD